MSRYKQIGSKMLFYFIFYVKCLVFMVNDFKFNITANSLLIKQFVCYNVKQERSYVQ